MKNTKRTLKALLASFLVTTAVAAPAVVLSSTSTPFDAELIFEIDEGASLVFHGDNDGDGGSVQLLVNVAVDEAVNCHGASFHLKYNRDYLTPSYIGDTVDETGAHKANEPIDEGGQQDHDGFFREDEDLFGLTDSAGEQIPVLKHEIEAEVDYQIVKEFYSHVDPDAGTIDMTLWLDDTAIYNALAADAAANGESQAALGAGKLTYLGTSLSDEDMIYVFNKYSKNNSETNQTPDKVVLGQLSFRVDKDKVAEVIALFDGMDVTGSYRDADVEPDRPLAALRTPDGTPTGETTFLLEINRDIDIEADPWQITYYGDETGNDQEWNLTPMQYAPDRTDEYGDATGYASNIAERYIFEFDRRVPIKVELTNPDFTINAYQNFFDGTVGDLRNSMGRYANMVTVTYSDGTKENLPFPWGRTGTGYAARYIKSADLGTDASGAATENWFDMTASSIDAYDPTANAANPGVGTDYVFSQRYQFTRSTPASGYTETEPGSGVYVYTFPIPVEGHMRVTPITVLDVTAENMKRTYPLGDVTTQVRDVNALELPSQARIITDIVPGGVSLVTPIKGWRPTQADSAWPSGTSVTALNSLKAESYDAATGYPYWPDAADAAVTALPSSDPNYAPERFVGEYWFETADQNGGTARGILKADIQDDFPWLTVPEASYDVGKALREIVETGDYVDPNAYSVQYVSTVTHTTSGGDANGEGQPTLTLSVARADQSNMAEGSVFRVWLPNGQELGTGQKKGGVTVDNWFNDGAKSAGDAAYDEHVNGFYSTKAQAAAGVGNRIFQLQTNPSDPAQPASTSTVDYHNDERETLRRYINLGGWYYVAVCETPDAADPAWTDPIPVYVPPRRNEYQESKTYNFIAENQSLFDWPGGVQRVMAFPRGSYDTVSPYEPADGTGALSSVGLPLYEVRDADGVLLKVSDGYDDPKDVFKDNDRFTLNDYVTRHSESYGVETLYDGQTGAQPGRVYSVKVDLDSSEHAADCPTDAEKVSATVDADTPTVYKYGPTPLQDEYRVAGFGTVYQSEADPTADKATLRRQLSEKAAQPQEKLTLTVPAWDTDGVLSAASGANAGNVELVTFNTVTEGYTVRQDHVLVLTNVGDVDIYGLDIDSLVDGYPLNDNDGRDAPEGGHFIITQAPASFLPAGCSTTFVLTYVYDLRAAESEALKYRDTLYITSTSHPTPGQGEDYLLEFDAELTVSGDPLHQVTVVYRPSDGSMGTAGIIVGEQITVSGGQNVASMNDTPTTRTYSQGESVYLAINQVDEYAVKSMTAVIDGTTVDLLVSNEYGPGLSLPNDGDFLGTAAVADNAFYVFEMPNHDVTVYVDFYEPIESKLRLDHLIDFSAPGVEEPDTVDLVDGYDPTGVYEPDDPGHIYQVWKKQFVGASGSGSAADGNYVAPTGDYAKAAAWSAAHTNADENFYLMTTGSAIPAGQGGNVYDSSNSHYLVVIDAEDDFSQIRAQLRSVKNHVDYRGTDSAHPDGYNQDVTPRVNMTLYYEGENVLDDWTGVSSDAVYDASHGYGPYDSAGNDLRPNGRTADSTYHISGDCDLVNTGFFSPEPGKSAYVHITVTYDAPSTATAEDDASGTREYFVEIHRRAEEPEVVLHYGNSPYGMIMNDSTKFATDAERAKAKSLFKSGYTFRDEDAGAVPTAALGKLQSAVYWREAWVRNQGVFEPESLTGFHQAANSDGTLSYEEDSGDTVPVYTPDQDVYDEADNLDLNDYAYFAILGRNMREPGVVSAKDSSGRAVSLYDIKARALDINGSDGVTLLDTTKTTQVERFSGADTAILDLGVAGQELTPLQEHAATAVTVAADSVLGVTQWPAKTTVATTTPAGGGAAETTVTHSVVEDIRPGRYIIEYSFLDFDGVSTVRVSRPFVILREVGDVNADGTRDSISAPASGNTAAKNDEYAIEDRVTHDPLGYEAGGWDSANAVETGYPYANIFKYRVADVNNDRNVNNIDANQLAKNVKAGSGWIGFYDPVEYGHPGTPMTAIPSGS